MDSRAWSIERHWVVLAEDSEPSECATIELSSFEGLVLLGRRVHLFNRRKELRRPTVI